MSYESPSRKYNRPTTWLIGFGVGSLLLSGCDAQPSANAPSSTSETTTTTAAPTTTTKAVHEGLALCNLLPDDFPAVTGSQECVLDRNSVINAGKDVISGDVQISAAASKFDDTQSCPVKQVKQNGVVCFDPTKWTIDAWGAGGEVVTLSTVVTGAKAPDESSALRIGDEILDNLAH